MTARFLHEFPARNALRIVKQNSRMGIVMCVLYLLGIPLIMGAFMIEMIVESHEEIHYSPSLEGFAILGFGCLGVAVFLGMFLAINSFTELHSKARVDMLYALPLTGDQRFFSDYLGGLCLYSVPYLITCLIGWIIYLCCLPFIGPDGSYREEAVPECAKYFALLTAGLFVLMLFYFTMTVFITVCCGTLFENLYTTILLNIMIPSTFASVIAIIADRASLDFEYLWSIIGYTSPIGGLIYLCIIVADNPFDMIYSSYYGGYGVVTGSEGLGHSMLPNYFRWIVVMIVITAALLVGAWQLYIRRKAEHVGKGFIHNAIYFVMISLITVLILCLIAVEDDLFLAVLIFSAIVYLVMEVVRKRGFRRFWLSLISYTVTVAVALLGFNVLEVSDYFGRLNYVPASAGVSSVALSLSVNTSFQAACTTDVRMEFTNREIIDTVIDVHRQLVKRDRSDRSGDLEINRRLTEKNLGELYYDFDYISTGFSVTKPRPDYNYHGWEYEYQGEEGNWPEGTVLDYHTSSCDLEITYYTLTGSMVHREYELNCDEVYALMSRIEDSDLYNTSLREHMLTMLRQSFGEWDSRSDDRIIPSTIKLALGNEPQNWTDHYFRQTVALDGGDKILEQIADAYAKDHANTTYEQRISSPMFGAIYNYPVFECYTETVALLKSWGFRAFTVPESLNFVDGTRPEADNQAADSRSMLGIRIYAPGNWSAASLEHPYSTMQKIYVDTGKGYAYDDVYPLMADVEMQNLYPELYTLLENAQINYDAGQEGCYLICINNTLLVLPPDKAELAETIIAKGDGYASNNLFKMQGGFYEGPDSTYGGFGSDDNFFYDYDSDDDYFTDYDPDDPEPFNGDDPEAEPFNGNSAPQSFVPMT